MPRDARKIPSEGFLHIMCRANNKRKIFLYGKDKNTYYLYLRKLKREENICICHYCIMPNHVHLLIKINEESNISKFMKRVNLKYAHYYSNIYKCCGHLWQGRFKSKIISNEAYLIQCGKYIELNPVRSGIVCSPEEYKFSSYRYYGLGYRDTLINPNPLYADFNTDKDKQQDMYRRLIIEEDKTEKAKIK